MQYAKQVTSSAWTPRFHEAFKGFEVVFEQLGHYWQGLEQFPTLDDYNHWIEHYQAQRGVGTPVKFIYQQADANFEKKVFIEKSVMTRAQHWHDFFNNLTWMLWPKLKWAIINRYVSEQQATLTRNSRQSFLAQWDECGILIFSANPRVTQRIFEHNWSELFFEKKADLSLLEVIVFGHGFLETGLMPYIGMTGKAVIIEVTEDYFQLSLNEKILFSDDIISQFILSDACYNSPKCLQPFPILGLPQWHAKNAQADFFENTKYFRPKRNTSVESVALNAVLDKNLWGQWQPLFLDR